MAIVNNIHAVATVYSEFRIDERNRPSQFTIASLLLRVYYILRSNRIVLSGKDFVGHSSVLTSVASGSSRSSAGDGRSLSKASVGVSRLSQSALLKMEDT